ncbi:MAG: Fic family protein [Armatimonadetes bacterium]|nr:Fic family protein [Armatimonadota bacterium]
MRGGWEVVGAIPPCPQGQGKTTYWAFLPYPLPPSLKAVLSSRIKGTQADLTELYAYEAAQLTLPGMKSASEGDAREVANYVKALMYGLDRLASLPVSLRLLRETHERLMEGVRGEHASPGEIRRSQNWIGRPGCSLADADYVPPPVPEMEGCLADLERYIHEGNQYPPLIRLALIHYQFEAIHPFLDGNGRIGRLLISLLLVGWDLLPLPLLYLSAYFERHKDTYYRLLADVSENGAWRNWVMFFLQGVASQSRDAVERAKQLQDLQQEWRRQLIEAKSPALCSALMESLFVSPLVSIPQAQKIMGVTYKSAQRNTLKLVEAGILKSLEDRVYGKKYIAPAILSIIEGNQP